MFTQNKDSSVLIKWFKDNILQLNPDKCKLLISNCEKDISLILENEVIECSESVKLLGVSIDNRLNFNEHVSIFVKKLVPNCMHWQEFRNSLVKKN